MCLVMVLVISTSYSDTHVSDPSCTVDQNSSNVSVQSSPSAVHIQ